MNAELLNDWRPETESLLKRLIAAGFLLLWADNGEDEKQPCSSIQKTIETLITCDEAWLRIKHPEGQEFTLYLVYGNSPGELVSDYSSKSLKTEAAKNLDVIVGAHGDEWERKGQPKATREEIYGKASI